MHTTQQTFVYGLMMLMILQTIVDSFIFAIWLGISENSDSKDCSVQCNNINSFQKGFAIANTISALFIFSFVFVLLHRFSRQFRTGFEKVFIISSIMTALLSPILYSLTVTSCDTNVCSKKQAQKCAIAQLGTAVFTCMVIIAHWIMNDNFYHQQISQ